MKKYLILIITFCSILSYSQSLDIFLGEYRGEMFIIQKGKTADTLSAELIIKEKVKDSIWLYKMTIHTEKEIITKEYQIIACAKTDTINYIMDEGSIKIEMTLLGNNLYSTYSINNKFYNSILRKSKSGLIFEIFASSQKSSLTSWSEKTESDIRYEVKSFKPILTQFCLFKKTN